MNIIAVLMGVAGAVFIVNKIYSTPAKVVFTESDNEFTAVLTDTKPELINGLGLTIGEQLVLQESATAGDVIVKAKGSSEGFTNIGIVRNAEFYKKVQQKRARAKIEEVSGDTITIAYSYS
ncbi:hypothetical protein ACLI09_12135 [Flavobacterium sp. RHBU_24]|uniref:hypothetical protein n=1 Tax=Flavobacterium sp. RHBU_24 TaxID=3391185 RepID=UPI00398471C3